MSLRFFFFAKARRSVWEDMKRRSLANRISEPGRHVNLGRHEMTLRKSGTQVKLDIVIVVDEKSVGAQSIRATKLIRPQLHMISIS